MCVCIRIRHVKCDEGKPTCKKCQDYKVVCDGYLPVADQKPTQNKPQTAHTHSKNDARPLFPLPRAYLDPDALRDDSWAAFFHHFRTSTITDLALPPYSTCFWDRHVLPLSNAIPAVRHAATALGVAHRAFLSESFDLSAPGEKQRLEILAVQQYNRAIQQLLPHASSGGPMNVRIIITCSLLFYCLENIRGCSAESLQHLRAGSQLVLSLPPRSLTETGQSGTNIDDSIRELSNLFARLGVEASLYEEDEVVPDLRSYMDPISNIPEDPFLPFPDFTVARNSLADINIDLGTYCNKSFVLARNRRRDLSAGSSPHSMSPDDRLDLSTAVLSDIMSLGPTYELQHQHIVSRFRCWRRRFDRTVAEAEKRGPSKRERQEIMMLELRRRVWETGLDEVPAGDPKQADSVLDQAELVVRSFSSKHPMFTLESNVMPSVSFICFYSSEERHRRRALDILRSARMREGVWDSDHLARNIETQFPELKLRGTVSTASSQSSPA
ncbi:hypothetical protein Daus18300_012476 [Diaporthe australafricana]|uniref:Zn(2)-C6 fungal-type domain-containing protein n=1 Tax=Diaporthe australafricana TaxID=127596 RepID=A0ABR3W2U6_9PEZI